MQPSVITKPKKKLRVGIPWIAVTAVLCLIIAGVAVWYMKPTEPRQIIRLSHELPEDQQLSLLFIPTLAVSPDGKQIVYSTFNGLYLRTTDELTARLIVGSEGSTEQPFFSPDGEWIGYFSPMDQQLKKIPINGGASIPLCKSPTMVNGSSWGEDGIISFGAPSVGIMKTSDQGGIPENIIKQESSNIGLPQVLPGGKAVLFTAFGNPFSIVVYSLESGETRELFPGSGARYITTGHLVYTVDDNLFAVPFDPEKLEVTGNHIPMQEGILRTTGVTHFTVSDAGTLAFIQGYSNPTVGRTLVWVNRQGEEEQIETEPNMYSYPRFSPDGTKVALTLDKSGNEDIWIYDLTYKILERLTFHDSSDAFPVWTSDGKRIIFRSGREKSGIYRKAADGTGEAEQVTSETDSALIPYSLSGVRNTLILQEVFGPSRADIGMLSLEDDHTYKLLLQEDYIESHPQVSPDGNWIAYCSVESDQPEIFVRPFPDVNKGKWQISTNTGNSPLWSPDGQELFYLIGDATTEAAMRVAVQTEPTFKKGIPEELFRGTYVGYFPADFPWAIHPDGNRFLMMKTPSATDAATGQQPKINIVLNWDEELKQRVPVD